MGKFNFSNPFGCKRVGEWTFKLSLVINFKLIAIVIASLLGLALLGGIAYGLVIGIIAIASFLWSIKWWLLGALIVTLIIWGLSKVNWKKLKLPKTRLGNKWLWWILALLLIILAVFLFRGCEGKDTEKKEVVVENVITPERFEEAFDWVVTSRAYLDGVQKIDSKTNRALVGLKFVNGNPVTGKVFDGKTYEEAMKVIAEDWRELVVGNLEGIQLSEQQIVVVTLFAMRNGKYGFLASDFLREIKAGKVNEADKYMALHKANGEKRILQDEAQQYLWVLKNMWNNNLSMKEILDYPMFSYKKLSIEQMYDDHGNVLFTQSLKELLQSGDYETSREALKLDEI